MEQKSIKTLLLGLGRIASILETDPYRYHPCTHSGTIFHKRFQKKFQLVGIYDIDPNKISQFKSFWKLQKKIATTIPEIKNYNYDFCIIASSSNAHFENARFAIEELKVKNLLIEKPVCLQLTELKVLLKLQKKYSLNIWINHERRYHPLYRYVKELIISRTYGELKTIRASVLTSSNLPGNAYMKLGGGPLLHDGTHAIDYIQWLLGKPLSINSYLVHPDSKVKMEEQAVALLLYPNHQFVFLEAGGKRKYFQFEIDIQTTDARIILSNDGHHIFVNKKSRLYKGFYSLKEIPIPKFPKTIQNPWINLYQEIYDFINNRTEKITSSLMDNKEVNGIIHSIYAKSLSLT